MNTKIKTSLSLFYKKKLIKILFKTKQSKQNAYVIKRNNTFVYVSKLVLNNDHPNNYSSSSSFFS